MTTTHAATRPASFDARLLSYQPAILHLARRYYPEAPEDMAQDVMLHLLGSWQTFREDGGFYRWIRGNLRYLAQQKREFHDRRKSIRCALTDDMTRALGTPPRQQDYAELSGVLGRLTGQGGSILLRRAMGDTLKEVGDGMGLTGERVRQIEERARRSLRRRVAA